VGPPRFTWTVGDTFSTTCHSCTPRLLTFHPTRHYKHAGYRRDYTLPTTYFLPGHDTDAATGWPGTLAAPFMTSTKRLGHYALLHYGPGHTRTGRISLYGRSPPAGLQHEPFTFPTPRHHFPTAMTVYLLATLNGLPRLPPPAGVTIPSYVALPRTGSLCRLQPL